jgi:hypothetical protein
MTDALDDANASNVAARWKDTAQIYPPPKEVVEALQDLGKTNTVKQKGKELTEWKYPKIEKLAAKLYSNIIKYCGKPEGLTKNVSRGKKPLYREIVISRRYVDVAETHPYFHEFQKDGKVFLISNNVNHCGLDCAVERFQAYIDSQVHQKNTARTSNDGLRLACILLDNAYRESVSGMLTKRKDRTNSDVPGDPNLHLFEKLLTECFSDPSYVVSPPSAEFYEAFPEEEKGSWDPNHPSIFEHDRSPEWLKATWEEYVRPKYKKALDKWNKNTGGGDGGPPNFVNYCAGDRWLVFLFCKDHDTNFLLANSARGRRPAGLQTEAGFDDTSSLSLSGSDGGSSAKRTVAFEGELAASKRHRQDREQTWDRLNQFLDSKTPRREVEGYIKKVDEYSSMINNHDKLDTMSPESKGIYLDTLKNERKYFLKKMAEASKNKN